MCFWDIHRFGLFWTVFSASLLIPKSPIGTKFDWSKTITGLNKQIKKIRRKKISLVLFFALVNLICCVNNFYSDLILMLASNKTCLRVLCSNVLFWSDKYGRTNKEIKAPIEAQKYFQRFEKDFDKVFGLVVY